MDKKVLIQDLADGLVLRRGLPKKDADVFVRSVFEIIGEYLQTDKIVKVKGLGTFKLVTVDSRESVDVNTGERIVIKKYTKINFTPDPVLRDAVNKPLHSLRRWFCMRVRILPIWSGWIFQIYLKIMRRKIYLM